MKALCISHVMSVRLNNWSMFVVLPYKVSTAFLILKDGF